MGYYTTFSLDSIGNTEIKSIEEALMERVGFLPIDHQCKWYKFEDDMRAISSKFPNDVLVLDGSGEENGDRWVAYFKNGKRVVHKMPEWIPPAYKESDLR